MVEYNVDGTGEDAHYCSPLGMKSHAEMKRWISKKLIEIVSAQDGRFAERMITQPHVVNVSIKWWRLEQYSKVVVKRDDVWWKKRFPDFERFWRNVERFRSEGLPAVLLQEVEAKKEKDRKKELTKKPVRDLSKFSIIADDDE